MPTFTDLGLSEPICRALDESESGNPTAFQQRAISLFLHGRDLLLISSAGPERTAAYVVPLLHRLSDPVVPAPPKEPRALVLTADRDEADAIGLALESFSRHVSLRFLVSSSNTGWSQQDRQLRTGVEILVTTPKRLLDLMREKAVKLTSIEIAVIDDVDDMIDQGLEPDLNKVVSALPGSYQTVAFAAAPAPELRPFVQSWMRNPLSIGGPAPRKATGKAGAGKQRVVSTLKLPDWLDEPPPELMPDWLEDEPGTAASAPAAGAKKPKGTTRRVPTPAEAKAQPPSTAKQAGSGKQAKDDLPAWLDDEPAAKAPASGGKKRKGTTRGAPTPAEAGDEAAQPPSTQQVAGSGKKPEDDLPAWLDGEPGAKAPASAAKTRKRGTPRVPTPAEAADAEAQPPPPADEGDAGTQPPPKKKTGTRRKGTGKGKTRGARP